MNTTTQWTGQNPLEYTSVHEIPWKYSNDSLLFYGSGFWFEDVTQYLRQLDSFGMVRHQSNLRPSKITSESLMLGLLLFEVFLVGFLLRRSLKLIIQYSKSGNSESASKPLPMNGFGGIGFSRFLWILTLIVLSLMAHVLVNFTAMQRVYLIDSFQIVKIVVFTFLYFLSMEKICQFVGSLFFSSSMVERWRYNNKVTLFIYAIVLSPVLISAEIGVINNGVFLKGWAIGFLIIAKFWLLIKTIRIFSLSGSGFFYFILYLCALEILPILLYYKGLFLL